jgi:hypothetical protein
VASQFGVRLNYDQRIRSEDDEIEQRMPAAGMILTESKSGGGFRSAIVTARTAAVLVEHVIAGLFAILGVVGLGVAMARADSPLAKDRPSPSASSKPRDASLDEYKQHLTALAALVDACAKARDLEICDPAKVGPDDRVPLALAGKAQPGEPDARRLIRYGWLRVLISEAQDKDVVAPEAKKDVPADSVLPPKPTTTQLLKDAEARLTHDLADADRAVATQGAALAVTPPAHDAAKAVMKQVLAGRDFRGLQAKSAQQSASEKVAQWINKLFQNASKLTAKSAWLGWLIVRGFIVAVCVGLIWGLIQFERRWRVRLVPESDGPVPGTASARDWQLWLEDARRAAAAGLWREAIHFVYWAAISRLESKRLWPADRARTPREYLALVAPEDARKAPLGALTRSFERVWYGGRPAGEQEYRRAEEIANGLISGGARAATVQVGGAAASREGAAQ